MFRWKCFVPGKANTDWAGGFYPMTLEFTDDYPAKPPKVRWQHAGYTDSPLRGALVHVLRLHSKGQDRSSLNFLATMINGVSLCLGHRGSWII